MADMAGHRHDRLSVGKDLDAARAVRTGLRIDREVDPARRRRRQLVAMVDDLDRIGAVGKQIGVLRASRTRPSPPARASGWSRAAARPGWRRRRRAVLGCCDLRPAASMKLVSTVANSLPCRSPQRQERAEIALRARGRSRASTARSGSGDRRRGSGRRTSRQIRTRRPGCRARAAPSFPRSPRARCSRRPTPGRAA